MKPRLMHRREVIALDNILPDGKVAYLAKKPQWDGAWYTADINGAKVFRHPGIASGTIRSYGESWKTFNPRVVNARTVEGYVDVPTAAAKRQARERQKAAELDARLRGKK